MDLGEKAGAFGVEADHTWRTLRMLVGHVAETHPDVGDLVSAVWLFTLADVRRRAGEDSATGRFLAATTRAYFGD